ncbi:MAG: hypothetical protein ACOH1K_06340 [Rhodoglobus sp.]
MSITAPRPTADSADRARTAVAWTSIQAGLWVGNIGGEFAGMIERDRSDQFHVSDRLAHSLGACSTLSDAKARHQRHLKLAQSTHESP